MLPMPAVSCSSGASPGEPDMLTGVDFPWAIIFSGEILLKLAGLGLPLWAGGGCLGLTLGMLSTPAWAGMPLSARACGLGV